MTDEQDAFASESAFESEERRTSPPPPPAGVAWGVITGFLLTIAVVVFAVQNTDSVPVRFLWLDGSFPLAIVILATAAVAVLIAELTGLVYRRRRRKRHAEKAELKELLKASEPD